MPSQLFAIAGATAIGLSLLMPLLLTSGGSWSDDDALQLSKAQQQLQRAVLGEARSVNPSEKVNLAKKRAEIEEQVAQLQQQLEGSLNRSSTPSMLLLVLGIGMVGYGWFSYQTMPNNEKPKRKKTLSEMDPDYVPPEVVDVTALDYTNAVRASKTGKHHH